MPLDADEPAPPGVFDALDDAVRCQRVDIQPRRGGVDGLMMGAGFTAVLMLLGGLREVLGSGTLLAGADRLFGPVAENWTMQLFTTDQPFLLAILPPGAFIGMGLIIAGKNYLDNRAAAKQVKDTQKVTRIRVTAES